jgi:hypothetical protein
LALQAGDLEAFLQKYGPRIAIGHLHGLATGRITRLERFAGPLFDAD